VFNRAVLFLAALLLLLLVVVACCACRYFPAQQLSRPELGCEVVDGASFRLVPQPGGETHLTTRTEQTAAPMIAAMAAAGF
jgi:hypothetical protein